MLTSKKVAITGSISSGKSTFCGFLKKLGATVVDADKIVHNLLNSSESSLGQKVLQLFGNEILVNGKINREKIADEVFHDSKKLYALENLLHPFVFEEIERIYQEEVRKRKPIVFVVEMPLLFETGSEKNYDVIVTLFREEKKCRECCKKKNYKERSQRLVPIEEKKRRSHFVIENDGSLQDLKRKAKNLMDTLTAHVL
jgi:dephospho-CoA kinase